MYSFCCYTVLPLCCWFGRNRFITLFSASELEDKIVGEDTELANSMGLFLQKTNIIRDYLEDNVEGREFWPKEVFSQPFLFMLRRFL